jgi:hypothetical protein
LYDGYDPREATISFPGPKACRVALRRRSLVGLGGHNILPKQLDVGEAVDRSFTTTVNSN